MTNWELIVLGIAQDGGRPHVGCVRECCERVRRGEARPETAACLALTDGSRVVLFEATPHLPTQLDLLRRLVPTVAPLPERVFLTHAHLGHYVGLLQFGKEAANAPGIRVHASPGMHEYLAGNAPWSRVFVDGNLVAAELGPIELGGGVTVTAIPVPHRQEHSDTVAFRIDGPRRSVLFLPDIDAWEDWELDVREVVASVDVAYLDATFHSADELPGRDLSQIPHPLVVDTMERLAGLGDRVRFLHLNHSNPVLDDAALVETHGFGLAREGERIAV